MQASIERMNRCMAALISDKSSLEERLATEEVCGVCQQTSYVYYKSETEWS